MFGHKRGHGSHTGYAKSKIFCYFIIDREQMMKDLDLSTEKKYWRPIPTKNKEFLNYLKKDQFTKICIYWSLVNRTIRKNLAPIKDMDKMFFKLENLNNKEELSKLLKFIGIKRNDFQKVFKKFDRPVNVRKPKNFKLNNKQEKIFREICGKEMINNGYKYDDFYNIGY